MGRKKLRQLRCLVTAQTAANLERLAQMGGCESIGRAVDKLVREKMLSLRESDNPWRHHIRGRFERVD